ncbi:MAG: hypothetical protein JO334_12610 [Verrucomicrobia bacterium]|nr:hypothetical protein [Verrucomicrobiota bacterium]
MKVDPRRHSWYGGDAIGEGGSGAKAKLDCRPVPGLSACCSGRQLGQPERLSPQRNLKLRMNSAYWEIKVDLT